MQVNKRYRLPAEWEPQSGIQLTWPHAETDWAPMLDEVLQTYGEMAREISKREPLLIVGPDRSQLPALPLGSSQYNYRYATIPTNDTWARDHGFITLVEAEKEGINGQSQSPSMASQSQSSNCRLLDFCFNGWGEKFPADLDNAINRQLYDKGTVVGDYVAHLDFVLEGGSIESDGRGTIFTTTCCLLAPHRNQPLTKEQIEERLKEVLCAERVLWIDHGSLEGDDTDGHIDTLVRIAPNDTLLYVKCDDESCEEYESLRLMEEDLRAFRTLEGQPYRLLPLPMPRTICDEDGQKLPATYANFLIVNGAVLCPTYAQPDLDAQALKIIGEAFPDREIVGIDCRSLIQQHGSLHCCTMQFPAGVLHPIV